MGLNHCTPIQTYQVHGKEVQVKRDDLHNGTLDLPPWAKLEGVRRILECLKNDKPIVHLTVRGSYTGWALAYFGKQYGHDIKIAYGDSKNYPKESLAKIEQYGAELVPLKPNMMKVLYNRMKTLAKEKEWQVSPYALDHVVYRDYWQEKLTDFDSDNLVLSAGSGVTAVGMIKGFLDLENYFMNKRVYAVCTSSSATVIRKFKEHNVYFPTNIIVEDTPYEFYDEMPQFETPFPCNSYWDKKAWWWLEQNIERIEGSILFWNIGA